MDRSKWEYKKLGEVCTVVSGSTPKTQIEEYWNGSHFWITPAELDGSTYVSKSERLITDLAIEKTNLTLLPIGTVLLSSRAPIGKVAITTSPMYCNQGFKNLICSPAVHNKYLYWFLKGKTDYLNSLGRGATFKEISKTIVENIKIPVYSLEAQQNISDEIDCLNEMIAVKQEQLKEFDKLAQSIFYDMFGDPVTNEKGWDIIKLGDICSCITKGTTPTTLGFPFVEEGINFVKVESFVDGKIDSSKLTHITHECHQALSRSQLESEDLLICIAGATIGKMAFVDASILPANTNQACAIVRLKDKNNLRYIHYYLALKLKNDIMKMGKGVAQPNLSLGQLRDFTISLPPLSLPQQFAEKISAIEAQKELVKQSIAETQQLLDYTMDKYFG